MKKILIILNIAISFLLLSCNKDEIKWEEIITDEVIEEIVESLDTENKIFLNVFDYKKMCIPLIYKDYEIKWEFDRNYLKLDGNIFSPVKNGTTILSANILDKKNIFVVFIENHKFVKTSQYNLEINYLFTTNNKKIGKQITPTKIVFHNTANTASALNEVKWLSNRTNTSSTSFHFAVDDKEVYQSIATSNAAYHAGNLSVNLESIGVEIAKSKIDDEIVKNKAIHNAALLISLLMNSYAIDIADVIPHYSASGKHCPHDIYDRYNIETFYQDILNLI